MMDKNLCALNPPRGWNSWDCYGAAVTEEILKKNADYMARYLKQYGYEYVVCDIQWYEPEAKSSHYRDFADLCMDEYGRTVPAENRFPSSAGGAGFRPIADYVHNLGLKFGIHIMRGIPRQAVHANTPVKGTEYTARQIAHPASICAWNTDMYGLDYTRPGAQEYIDSLFELYASWEIDFIKIDDICVIYGIVGDESTVHYGGKEIEMYRRAIDKCGRPIVLSLSPGPAMLSEAEHLRKNANMWRMTNDFWDDWNALRHMFDRCREWSPYVSEGCFPDCDMLPVGHISIIGEEGGKTGRNSNFTREEQKTMLSLWSIFRAPLILGCELNDLDEWTKELITNEDVLRLNQDSRNAREISRSFKHIMWKAEDIEGNIYVALFNVAGWTDSFILDLRDLGIEGNYVIHDLWSRKNVGNIKDRVSFTIAAHDVMLIKLSCSC